MAIVSSHEGAAAVSLPRLLLDGGLISRNDLAVAEHHAARERVPFVEAVVSLGLVLEPEAYRLLAQSCGVECVTLEDAATSELAIRLVPEKLARRHLVVPISVDNRTLVYATCRPLNDEADRDLAFASGRRATFVVATRTVVLEALDRTYPKMRDLDVLAERIRAERPTVENDEHVELAPAASAVIDMCNHIIGRFSRCP